MNRMLSIVVAFSVSATAARSQDDRARAEEVVGKLQGVWLVGEATLEGEKMEPMDVDRKPIGITIRGDRITSADFQGRKMEVGFRVVVGNLRLEVDLTPDEGGDKRYPGIFELKGDVLRVAISDKPGQRPGDYVSKGGSGVSVLVLKRKENAAKVTSVAPKDLKVPPVHTTGAPLALAMAGKEIDLDRLLSLARDVLDEAAGTRDPEAQDALLASLIPLGGKGSRLLEGYSTDLNERIVELARNSDIDPTAFRQVGVLGRFQGLANNYGSVLKRADWTAEVQLKAGVESHQHLKKYFAKYGTEDRSLLLGESALLLSRAAQARKQWDIAEAYASEALAIFQRSKFTAHEPTARALLELAKVAQSGKDADAAKRYNEAARKHLAALLAFREDLLGKEHPLSRGLRARIEGSGRFDPPHAADDRPKKVVPAQEDTDAIFKRAQALEKKEPREAAALYEKAARAGHGHAQMLYGIWLNDGDVIPRDRQGAITWLRKAIANPNLPPNALPVAQFNLRTVMEDRD